MKYLLVILFGAIIISCNNQADPAIEAKETAKSNETQAKEKTLGQVPGDNPIFLALKDGKTRSVNEADALYRENIDNAKETDYQINLKHLGFKLVCEAGLNEKGSKVQKEFYLNEQIRLERNFPGFENFFSLLASCDFLSKAQKLEIAEAFYNKNLIQIDKVTWPEEKNKSNKIIKLKRSYTLFQRRV